MVLTSWGLIPDAELKSPFFPPLPVHPLGRFSSPVGLSFLDPKLSYFAGYFFGDGGLKDVARARQRGHRDHKLIIADEFEIQIQTIQSLYADLFGRRPPIRFERISKGERTIYINPTDKRTYLFLTSAFELPCGSKTHTLHIPALIWNAPPELQWWFLRGLFDAEGDTRAMEKTTLSAPRIKIRMKCILFIFEVKRLFEHVCGVKMSGPYFDPGRVSAYIQVNRFRDIVHLNDRVLFLHPIKRWRLEKQAVFLQTRTRFFKDS